ncbi:MAG: metal ABC transporter permease [Candidatus Nitrosocaldaceae archaeon]|nr:MAG: metal ABC transporter permease [Candidatus Nitrosocaldaceae archaeon]
MIDILSYLFIQKALMSGIVISIACSMLGLFLVMRRYSLFGDAMAHVALSGIAIGIFLNIYPLWSSLLTSILASLGITKLRKSSRLQGDIIIAVLLITGVASAVLLISASEGFTVDLFSYLFGSIFLISNEDFIAVIIASIGIVSSLIILKDRLLFMALDEEQAKISGINTEVIDYIFMILASIIVIIAIRLVGVLLVSSLIVLPNIASIMLGKGFKDTLLASIGISIASVIIGILASYYLDLAPSGMIVLVGVLALLIIAVNKRVNKIRLTIKQ